MTTALPSCGAAFLVLALLWPAVGFARTHALVIGCNRAEEAQREGLRYADDDAVLTHLVLQEAGVRSVLLTRLDPDSRQLHPTVRADGPALLSEIEKQLARLSQEMAADPDAEFLLFYSGHGNVELGEGYVVLEEGRLTRSRLFALLGKVPARRNHVIVDACRSYFLAFGRGAGGKRTPYRQDFIERDDPGLLERTGFVLSTSSNRESHEWERFGAGVFSHQIRSALRGAADLDGDERISYAELGAFLENANHSIPNARYRPDFMVRPPGSHPGDLQAVILKWRESAGALVMDTDRQGQRAGHVYVEDARGVRLVDSNAGLAASLTLRLPKERPLFVRRGDGSSDWVLGTAGPARLSRLEQSDKPPRAKGALHLAFETLFATPFDRLKLEAYVVAYRSGPDPLWVAAQAEPPLSSPQVVQRVALWTGVGAVTLGAALNLWALDRQKAGAWESHQEQARLNRQIQTLNTLALVSYGLAGAAALTWLGAELWEGWSVGVWPGAIDGGIGVSLGGRF